VTLARGDTLRKVASKLYKMGDDGVESYVEFEVVELSPTYQRLGDDDVVQFVLLRKLK
jgi:hypothetical protein